MYKSRVRPSQVSREEWTMDFWHFSSIPGRRRSEFCFFQAKRE